jgi:hypothetical protein
MLIFLWIIPNGLWLVLPSYMIYALGDDILNSVAAPIEADETKKAN